EHRQHGAELDQHLEGLARRLEAQEMADEQQVPGGGYRDELGRPLDEAEQDHLPGLHRRSLGRRGGHDGGGCARSPTPGILAAQPRQGDSPGVVAGGYLQCAKAGSCRRAPSIICTERATCRTPSTAPTTARTTPAYCLIAWAYSMAAQFSPMTRRN